MFTKTRVTMGLLLVLCVLVMSGCNSEKKSAVPQTFSNVNVVTAHSSAVQYPAGSKYAFVTYAADSDQKGEVALIDQRIQTALTDELKKKGYKPGEYSDVNFFVAYTFGLQQQIDVLVGKSKVQGNEWITAIVTPSDYVSGAVLVQIIDAKSMEPVWLGVINADVKLVAVSEKAKRERVGYAVRELLKNFPPK
jgi:hypothetical protein